MTTAEKLIKVAENVPKVYNAGYEKGKSEGGSDSFYDAFWDSYQTNGERMDYSNAFMSSYNLQTKKLDYAWTNETFRPKYNIKPLNAQRIFKTYWGNSESNRTPTSFIHGDLVETLDSLGVVLDFSNCTNAWEAFFGSNFTRLGVIDFSSVTYNNALFFNGMTCLVTIDYYIPPRVILTGAGAKEIFNNCKSLKNLTLGGNLLQNTDLKYSPLTLESAISVITHLENYAGTENEFKYTITFSETTWGYLDADGDASPNGNSWREYINDLGWNAS